MYPVLVFITMNKLCLSLVIIKNKINFSSLDQVKSDSNKKLNKQLDLEIMKL
jgi:hypothetical protein